MIKIGHTKRKGITTEAQERTLTGHLISDKGDKRLSEAEDPSVHDIGRGEILLATEGGALFLQQKNNRHQNFPLKLLTTTLQLSITHNVTCTSYRNMLYCGDNMAIGLWTCNQKLLPFHIDSLQPNVCLSVCS